MTEERQDTGLKTVVLAARCDVAKARPLAEELLSLRGEDVALDASAVEYIGVQCLQVLMSAKRTWENDGASISVAEKSPAFIDAFAHIGMPLACETEAPGELCL